MPNAFQHPSIIANEFLQVMRDRLVIAPLCYTDKTADFSQRGGYRVGDTIQIKQYGDYEVKDFTSTVEVQDIRNTTRNMQIEKHFDITVELTARERALELDSLVREVITPAGIRFAEKVDKFLAEKITSQATGLFASNTLLATATDLAAVRKGATYQQISEMERNFLVDLDLDAQLLGSDYFNQVQLRGDDAQNTNRNGFLGQRFGFDFFSSINFDSTAHTAGNGASTGTNNTGGATNLQGDLVLTVVATTGTINAGDRIAIAGVRRPLIAASSVAPGSTAIPLVDPITEIIPDASVVSTIGAAQTYTHRGAVFANRAMALAMPPLDLPPSENAYVLTTDGSSLRVVESYDTSTKKTTLSIDCLIGAEAWDPRKIMLVADY